MNLALPELDQPIRLRFARPMTDQELMRFSAENSPLRVERDANGELILMTPTGNRTGLHSLYIGRMLGNWADDDGRGYAFDSSTGFSLPDGSMRSPDASWILAERWNALTEAQQDEFSPLCPDFVVELRSPSDNLQELQEKMQMWIANGAELAWLIDRTRKVVEIYRPGSKPEVQDAHTSAYGEGIVGGFILELGRIWA